MGNMQCPAEDAALLASVARDICPFPNYNPNPLFINMLSINSSFHLRDHYRTVQSSLTPEQLEVFTQDLRTTFGREGKVTLGGVGVVALSLAVLFDSLASEVRGESVSDSGPIPGLFLKDPRGCYPPQVYTVSEYLRLVPYIVNNPTRMKKQTRKFLKQLITDDLSLDEKNDTISIKEDITAVNVMLGFLFTGSMYLHIHRINATLHMRSFRERTEEPDDLVFNLNCDPEAADKEFLAKVQQSDRRTQEAFERCKPGDDVPKTWLHHVARLEWRDIMNTPKHTVVDHGGPDAMIAQREDFDLKADSLGHWVK